MYSNYPDLSTAGIWIRKTICANPKIMRNRQHLTNSESSSLYSYLRPIIADIDAGCEVTIALDIGSKYDEFRFQLILGIIYYIVATAILKTARSLAVRQL